MITTCITKAQMAPVILPSVRIIVVSGGAKFSVFTVSFFKILLMFTSISQKITLLRMNKSAYAI